MAKAVLLLLLSLTYLAPTSCAAAPLFAADGNFVEWFGQPSINDGEKDGIEGEDLKSVSWGTNPNDDSLYFMVERHSPVKPYQPMVCRVYFDINNNGRYEDRIDKYAEIIYQPDLSNENATVKLFSMSGKLINSSSGNWGEKVQQGAARIEIKLNNSQLELMPPQQIRFFVSSVGDNADRMPGTGDILWKPFPGATFDYIWVLAGAVLWIGPTVFFFKHKIWMFYFIWGAVGLTFILIMLVRGSMLEFQMEHFSGIMLYQALNTMGILAEVYDKAPGTLLVLIRVDSSWTTVDVDIETSGILEMCVFLGLLSIYPSYSLQQKFKYCLFGVLLIYGINLIRMLVVITLIHLGGRDIIFFAHSVIGRLIYFILTIALYWAVFTRPALKVIKEQVEHG